MLKPLSSVALLAMLIGSPARTDQSPIAPAFGNTILSTYPDGRTGELWLKPDGSYTAMGRRKDQSNGHWKVHDQKLCLKQAHPFAPPFSFCTPIPSGGFSAAWSAKSVSGEPIKITLVKGRATGAPATRVQ